MPTNSCATDGSPIPGDAVLPTPEELTVALRERIAERRSDELDRGMTLKMPPRDGFRAMVRDPDGAIIEFHQIGERKAPAEPWLSMADGA